MARAILLAALALGWVPCAARAAAASKCFDAAQTQLELNQCADEALRQAQVQQRGVYRRILRTYAGDPLFISKLRAAQRAWKAFRNAEVDALYPHRGEAGYYGSVLPMCLDQRLTALTRQRTKMLRRWLTGSQEGDACAGSIRPRGKHPPDPSRPSRGCASGEARPGEHK